MVVEILMTTSSYQLAIIGGGPGGYVAAIRAAQLGFKVAIIEKQKNLGGTCLNWGCIPSKALLTSTEHYHAAHSKFAAHGITFKDLQVDIPTLMKRKEGVVGNMAKGIDFLMKKNKIDRVNGFAKFIDSNTIEIDHNGAKQTLKADRYLIATGSVPIELPFLKFDGETVVSSDQSISFSKAPQSLLVIGAGAIGLELGSVWKRLGTEVKVLEFLPRIAPGFDLEVANTLQRSLTKQGIEFHLKTKVESAKVSKGSVTLEGSEDGKPSSFSAEKVLVAVGRKPFFEGLELDKLGIQLTARGRIQVDSHFRTNLPNIFAIGDVIDGPMLAHKAEEDGVAFAELLAGKPGHVNYDLVPGVVYTSPEGAGVGLTEDQCKEKGLAVKVGKFNFMGNGRAVASDAAEGFAKVIADAKTDRVLGFHLLSANASELIAEAVLLMEFGGSSEDLARTIHAHPTTTEALKEAALAVEGRAIHS
jgi:dihydrolipoamide dehydrogenase